MISEDLSALKKEIERYLRGDEGKMSNQNNIQITMSDKLYDDLTQILQGQGLTIEQALTMFLKWCAAYPETASKWLKENRKLAEENNDESITVFELD